MEVPFIEHWVGVDLAGPAPPVVLAGAGASEETVFQQGKGRGKEGTSMDGRSAQVTRYIYKCTQYQP